MNTMPLIDISNPKRIRFLIENYEKENRLRLKWIEKHREAIYEAATLKREPKHWFEPDIIAYKMASGLPTLTRDHINTGYNRRRKPILDVKQILGAEHLRHGHSIVNVGLGDTEIDVLLKRPDTDTSPDPIMRPVDPKVRNVIYKPKPEFGRLEYLKRRTKEKPENKYYFTQSENFNYGWRLMDSKLGTKPSYGRCWHLTKAIRSRVSPTPNPSHYKPPEPPGPSKCTNV